MRMTGSGASLTAHDSAPKHAPLLFIPAGRHRSVMRRRRGRRRNRRRVRPGLTRRSRSRGRPLRTTRVLSRSAPRSPRPPRAASMPSSHRWSWSGAFSGAAISASASIRASPRLTISPSRSRWNTATAPAGKRSQTFAAEAAVEPLESRPGVICAPARPDYDGIEFSKLLDTLGDERHRLGLSARGRNAGPRAPRSQAPPDRHARAAFRPPARLRGSGQRTQPRPYPMGACRPARRQAGLCCPRQSDVADRRTALLHQGLWPAGGLPATSPGANKKIWRNEPEPSQHRLILT